MRYSIVIYAGRVSNRHAKRDDELQAVSDVRCAMQKPDLPAQAVAKYLDTLPSGFGELSAVRHAATLSKTAARWVRPSMPLGSHPACWPTR